MSMLWTREELILALNLYLKLPFGKMHAGNPEVIELANLIGRTPSSIAMRLTNYAHVDPFHIQRGIKGLAGGKAQVEPIWDEFVADRDTLLFESERILAEYQGTTIEQKFSSTLIDIESYKGEMKTREVKVRVNQNIFRQIVLANYESRCAVSGIDIPTLLTASHIIPWSANEEQRLNPENGICLSPLYDKLFDKGFLSVTDDFLLITSPSLSAHISKSYYTEFISPLQGRALLEPTKYYPDKSFLAYHRENIFLV
jgi:putative restriction endonuclease